jgi:hypothetical protein
MNVDIVFMSRDALNIEGIIKSASYSNAVTQMDIGYYTNGSSFYDIYLYIKSGIQYISFDLDIGSSGAQSTSNVIIYDPSTVVATTTSPGALTSITAACQMYINGSNVGIGTNNVFSALHVYGQSGFNSSNGIVTLIHSTTPTTWSCGPNANGIFVVLNGAGNTGVQLSSGTSSWTAFSDKRLKRDIVSIDSALSLLLQLRPVNFNYKTDIESEKPRSGFIAQEVQQLFPNDKYWIISNNIGTFNDDNGNEFNAFGLSMTEMIPYLVKAVQEQNMIIQQQSTHIATLEPHVALLESKLATQESQIDSLLTWAKTQGFQ